MAGVSTEESGIEKSTEGVSSEHSFQSGEALVEWRSSEQVENGTPSTCSPYWDSDDNDDGGPKRAELFGKYTWKIEKFSQINKRELRSNAFEIGGCKCSVLKNALGFLNDVYCIWYILIYPQGCDVCNHLSLFLCVASHDKLLPGWSHFAQFTIAVVNKDPKKSKYSDTLHRFWKKEHDWGWKKFMELPKLLDGFIDADALLIKAQVQVIRERSDRPFRCLDSQYRRELVRVYLINVEQICRRYVEERRGELGKLMDDKAKWSSFREFCLGMDQNLKRRMSREKTDSILKVLVKHFFIEKEVTSTLVMDSLYSGIKALEGHYKGKKSKDKYMETEELPFAFVRMEKDTFLLVDDVLTVLERFAIEPLPPKDEKGPQDRTKDGALGEEFNRDSIEHDERRLTELGRRTIEIFVLVHIFSKIEATYQEAVALKRQEELIREEEEAWLAEIEQKARRGGVDREKKSKKKQGVLANTCNKEILNLCFLGRKMIGKQKRRKGKDKGRNDKHSSIAQVKIEQDIHAVERTDFAQVAENEIIFEISDTLEDVSDVSDSVERVHEILLPDSEDTDTSEVPPMEASSSGTCGVLSVQNGTKGRSSSAMDDSSSTCSSDSVPFVKINGSHRGNPRYKENRKSPSRGSDHQSKVAFDPGNRVNAEPRQPSRAVLDAGHHLIDASRSFRAVDSLPPVADRVVNGAEKHAVKGGEPGSLRKSPFTKELGVEGPQDSRASCTISVPRIPSRNIPSIPPTMMELKDDGANNPMVKNSLSESHKLADKSLLPANSPENAATPNPDTLKFIISKPTEKLSIHQGHVTRTTGKTLMPVMSRPLSAPLVSGSAPDVSLVPVVQTSPILSRSASSVSAVPSHAPQSYRNSIVDSVVQNHSTSSGTNVSFPYSQAPTFVPAPFSVGVVSHHDMMPNAPLWIECPQRDLPLVDHSLINNMQNLDRYSSVHRRAQDHCLPSGCPSHMLPDEFPHLDIINDLLDDEHGIGNLSTTNECYQGFGEGPPHYLGRKVRYPGDQSGPGPATASCRLERTRSYHGNGFQQSYGASGGSYDARHDAGPQVGPPPYIDVRIDGLVPNQWRSGFDLPFMSFGNTDIDSYHVAGYQNPTVGANGYTVFRPSSGL
ncbi:hypothetical protein OROGR_008747 [Orobanche gracilis]